MKDMPKAARILRQHYQKKKEASRGKFSLRAMAMKLSISPSYLSQVFSGNRKIPNHLLDPLCDILDMDEEKRVILSMEMLKAQGWGEQPSKPLRDSKLDFTGHAKSWTSKPPSPDLLKFTDYQVLEATQLKCYDGTTEYLHRRLSLPIDEIAEALGRLEQLKLLKTDGRGYLVKTDNLLEVQSRKQQRAMAEYQSQALEHAKTGLGADKPESDIKKRIISTALFTCSNDQVPLLRAKIAEFLKTIASEAIEGQEDQVYQFTVAFLPATKNDSNRS